MSQPAPKIERPWYEPAIARHFPSWHANREAARLRSFAASYAGGIPTRTSETWQKAEGFRFDSSQERQQQESARSRGRNTYRNNPVAGALIDAETDNVIGDGLNYQPTTDDEAWNREAQDRYWEWLDTASVRGGDIHTGCELPRLIWSQSRYEGDIGWVLVVRNGFSAGSESKIQIVKSENIVTPDGKSSDPSVYDGIKFDEFGAPVTYYVLSHDERGVARRFTPVPARDFVFLPHFGDTNQSRGETCFMKVFKLLDQITKYVDSVALAAWMAAVFGLVFKQTSAGKQYTELEDAVNSAGNLQKAVRLEAGMVKYVGTEDEVAQVQAHQPMQNTPDFIRSMLRLAGMVFRMPLEAFALDMSTCNFASARIGLLPFYRSCKIKGQGTFGARWSRTIRWWLSRERLRVDGDPRKWKTAFPERFWAHDLLSNAWEYTDPVQEVKGDMLQCDAGFKSPQMVIAERGRDAERILRERLEWMEKTDGLPRTHSTESRDPTPEPVEPEPEPEPEPSNGNGRITQNT